MNEKKQLTDYTKPTMTSTKTSVNRTLIPKGLIVTQHELHTLEHYIHKTVLPRLGRAGSSLHLEPTTLGNRNRIFFLTVGTDHQLVLKGFASKTRLHNSLIANRFLARYGIAAPRILFADASEKTRARLGWYVSCEEKIDGTPVEATRCDSSMRTAIAAFFARLHSLRSSRWGSLRSPQCFGFRTYLMRKIRERVHSLTASGTQFPGCDPRTIVHWFESNCGAIKAVSEFSLCHGDVNTRNILVTHDNRVVIIDTEALKYLPFPIEYFRLLFFLCQDDAHAQQEFSRCYFENTPHTRYKEFVRCKEFYQAFVLLEFAWYFNKKIKQNPAPDRIAKQRYHFYKEMALNRLLSTVSA